MGVGDDPWAIPESSRTISEISEIHEILEVGPEIRFDGPQLKDISEHIFFVFSNSVVKVDISEERPLERISFREFLIEYRLNPLTFEKVVPEQSFSLRDEIFGQISRFS